jgi:hypothetical protein
VGEGDCDDTNADINPGMREWSTSEPNGWLDGDGIDNDCDGKIDEGTADFDDDQDGFTEREGDCDDANGERYPGKVDGCDGTDNDCDGEIDEDAGDDYEPNDTAEEAADVGDVSCSYAIQEINIANANDHDFFRFQVCDSVDNVTCSASCPHFWLEVQLQNIPPGLDFTMNLYREVDGEPSIISSLWSTASADTPSIQLGEIQGHDDGGTFLIEVLSGIDNGGVSCNDDTRLVIFGQKPVALPVPEPTPAAN